jgi:hypothetical protein
MSESATNPATKALLAIQRELHVGKDKENSFGGFKYRSLDDINLKVKPLAIKNNAVFFTTDEIHEVAGKVFVVGVATLKSLEGGEPEVARSPARLEDSKKGMDAAQLSGSTSSYARKQAAAGLFALTTDAIDHDAMEPDVEVEGENEFISEDQVIVIDDLIREASADKIAFLKHIKAPSVEKITQAQYQSAVKALEYKKKQLNIKNS